MVEKQVVDNDYSAPKYTLDNKDWSLEEIDMLLINYINTGDEKYLSKVIPLFAFHSNVVEIGERSRLLQNCLKLGKDSFSKEDFYLAKKTLSDLINLNYKNDNKKGN